MNRQFLIFIAIIQGIIFLVHWLVYKCVAFFFFSPQLHALPSLRLLFFLLSITFITSMLASSRFYNGVVRFYYKVAAVWLGSLYFWIAASLVTLAAYFVSLIFSPAPNIHPFAEMIFAAAALGLVAAFVNARTVRTTAVTVQLGSRAPKLVDVWKGKRAVWASDLHIGHMRGWRHAKRVVQAINTAKPDIVFIGGDLFDGVSDEYAKAIAPLKGIEAPLGTYFIFGNHEEFSANDAYAKAIRGTGIKILNDEKVEIEGMQIVGVDYHTSHDPEKFKAHLERLIDREKPSIVLKHEPNNLDVAEDAGVSLQISGHTHKAQMWPFNYIARKAYKGYEYGLKQHGALQELTSSGAGTWGPPYRVGSRTEIVVIDFV